MGILRRLWVLRGDRPVFVSLSFLLLLTLFVYPVVEAALRSIELVQPWNYQDYSVYAEAVDDWLAGDPIYTPNEDGGFWGQYLYPPVFLVLFRPLSGLGHYEAGLAWGVFSVLLLWLALQVVASRLDVHLEWWERLLGLWLLVGFHPLVLSVKLGQTAGFLGALLTVALAGLLGDDRVSASLSGALTAVVGLFKFAYAPVGAHLLVDRRRFAGALGAGLFLGGLSIALFGFAENLAYLDVLRWGVERGSGSRVPKPSLWLAPYFRQLHWLPGALFVRVGIAALVTVGAILSSDADREVFALGVATFLLVTPLPYVYYFVAALPALIALLAVELDRDGVPSIPIVVLFSLQVHAYGLRFLGGIVADVLGGAPDLVYPLLQPGLWGVVLFFALAAYRVGQSIGDPRDDVEAWVGDR
ncbi:glycosyltransferase family 87 protein [Halanaeroarchaeum sp. HSR-CO]|uniref:glycosyltransferase family 87 protein n=1 Tax=Halanaeroarchaeum sp. HSR-CO TaxID=2866382 RepID=UPI00217CF908|nr:glycosyltransferase family 87 protein [Halanaeroarchaeum sp. HSR-CO]